MADEVRDILERLIFEVHGADEGARLLKELQEAEEEHAKSLKGLTQQAKATAKEQTKAAKEMERAAKKQARETEKQARETEKIVATAQKGIAALAVLAAKASSDLERANDRVERSFKRAGASSAEMNAGLEQVDARARRLGIGLVDTREQLSEFLDATGDAATALQDMALAQDIVATGDADAKQAQEALTKARKGEVSELIRLDGLNKTQIDSLLAITTDGERAAAAIKLLQQNYAGAADELKGSEDAWKNILLAGEDFLALLGDAGSGLIGGTAEFLRIVDEGDSLLSKFGLGLRNMARDAREVGTIIAEFSKQGGFAGQLLGGESLADISARLATERQGTTDAPARDVRGRGVGAARGVRSRQVLEGRGAETIEELRDRLKKENDERIRAAEERERLEQEKFDARIERNRRQLEFFEQEKEKEREIAEFRREAHNQQVDDIAELEDRRQQASDANLARIFKSIEENKKGADKEKKDAQKSAAEADKVRDQAVMASTGAASSIADSVIEGEVAKAVVKAAFETAAGFAALAVPNPAGAALHFIAAAQYAAIGGIAAAKGGGGAKSKGGGAPSGAGTASAADEAGVFGGSAQDDGERVGLFGESDLSAQRGGAGTTLNIFTNFPPTPEQARGLFDTVKEEEANRTDV